MATPAPAPSEALDLDLDPPAWLATLIVAIGAIVPIPPEAALAALQALCRPYAKGGTERALTEGLSPAHRALFTGAYAAKWDHIEAARTAPPVAPVLASVPTTVQAPPVAPVASMREPMVHPARWAPLMRAANGALRTATNVERTRRVDPAEWGARVENPAEPVVPGSLVRITSERRGGSQVKAVASVVAPCNGGVIVALRDATDADRAPRPVTSAPSAPSMPEGAIPLSALMPDAIPASVIPSGATAEQALGEIATEARSNATATRAPEYVQGAGQTGTAHADSGASVGIFERPRAERRPLVGDGTIRVSGRFGTSQAVSGSGTTPALAASVLTERARLLSERHLIVGNLAADGWLQISWTGERQTEHGAAMDALIAVGREGDAPGVPSAEHFASEALNVLRGRSWDIKRAKLKAATTDSRGRKVKARWIVGRAGVDGAADAGDAYGRIALRVDLVAAGEDEDTLDFDGDTNLADQVRSEYSTRVAGVVLTSRVLTPWLGRILRTRHGAVKRGHCWYVPPGHAQAVRALIGGPNYAARVTEIVALAKSGAEELPALPAFDAGSIGSLWGDHELQACSTGPDLFASLTRGLLSDVQRVAADFATKTTDAKERARDKAREVASKRHNASEAYIEAEGKAAYDRATISAPTASTLLETLGTCAARVSGYQAVLGAESVREATTLIASLRTCLASLTDDTALRFAMLDLDREAE